MENKTIFSTLLNTIVLITIGSVVGCLTFLQYSSNRSLLVMIHSNETKSVDEITVLKVFNETKYQEKKRKTKLFTS